MQTLISYTSDSRAYLDWIKSGKPADTPDDVPFGMPDETRKGDRYLLYVGGIDKTFVGWGKVLSDWKPGTGLWKGHDVVQAKDHIFREPRLGSDVEASTGFRIPRRRIVIPEEFAALVWRAATAKRLSPSDRAVEGILTESRSRRRNPALRTAALQRAQGQCAGCGVNFVKKWGELGSRCLVVHHKNQMKDLDQPRETRLSELVVVCANCHMMIHANPAKALTISELKRKIGARR